MVKIIFQKCPDGIDCSADAPDYPISIVPELFQNPCPIGYYCENPDGNTPDPIPCPGGTFGGETGLQKEDECSDCPAGQYCPDPTSQSNVPNCAEEVLIGNYTCNLYNPCQPGRYCPEGSENESLCPVSTYQPFTLAKDETECRPCPSGYYCDIEGLSNPKDCVGGFFCPFNSTNFIDEPCPPGTYSQSPNLRSAPECGLCDSGKFCSGIIIGNVVEAPVDCAAGSYCTLGSKTEDHTAPCDLTVDEIPGITCAQICPLGAYCPQGTVSFYGFDFFQTFFFILFFKT